MEKKHKFKIGSHNSMTYLPPKKWYMYPFKFVAKCQSSTIEEQYEKYSIRMFDIRISFDKETGKPEFRHGLISYKGNVDKVFEYLNSKGKVYVRLILEEYKEDKTRIQEEYHFKYNPRYEDKYSSNNKNGTTGTIMDDWFPWLYARFNNKKNIKKGTDKPWLLIDFVNIR